MSEAVLDVPSSERRVDLVALARTVRLTSKRSKKTDATLQQHVQECSRKQTLVLRVSGFILAWVVAHSPEGLVALGKVAEAATAIAKVAKVIVP